MDVRTDDASCVCRWRVSSLISTRREQHTPAAVPLRNRIQPPPQHRRRQWRWWRWTTSTSRVSQTKPKLPNTQQQQQQQRSVTSVCAVIGRRGEEGEGGNSSYSLFLCVCVCTLEWIGQNHGHCRRTAVASDCDQYLFIFGCSRSSCLIRSRYSSRSPSSSRSSSSSAVNKEWRHDGGGSEGGGDDASLLRNAN